MPGASPRYGEGPRAGRPGRVAAEFDVAPRARIKRPRGRRPLPHPRVADLIVAAAREKGLAAARAEANARKRARKQKKARRRFGTDCALGAGCDPAVLRARTTLTHSTSCVATGGGRVAAGGYLMVLYLVGPVALGVGAAPGVARWVLKPAGGGAAAARQQDFVLYLVCGIPSTREDRVSRGRLLWGVRRQRVRVRGFLATTQASSVSSGGLSDVGGLM